MKILTVLTYYRPHTSGLTIYAERLAKALVMRGHEVTVLTSQFEDDLLPREVVDGVNIVRLPVAFRVSKGVIVPSFGWVSTKMVLDHDAVLLHLPQFDAAGVALRGRLFNKPTAITYHCDLLMPPGAFNWIVNQVVLLMNNLAGIFSHRVVAYTEDFACHSPFLTKFEGKREIILPPVELPNVPDTVVKAFRDKHNSGGAKTIGMATRFASEKGVEILLEALPKVMEKYPNTKVLFAGQYKDVWGEQDYFNKHYPTIKKYEEEGKWEFLGVLKPEEMAAFFPNLDVLVVPSLNSTESFGLVQIEAMMNGTPVIASDLPGVRQPVKITGMGEISPIGGGMALGAALLKILDSPESYSGDPDAVREQFKADVNAAAYEAMFERMMAN